MKTTKPKSSGNKVSPFFIIEGQEISWLSSVDYAKGFIEGVVRFNRKNMHPDKQDELINNYMSDFMKRREADEIARQPKKGKTLTSLMDLEN